MDNRHADLMRQGFMKPMKKARAPRAKGPTVTCDACLNWHEQGKHTAPAAARAANLRARAIRIAPAREPRWEWVGPLQRIEVQATGGWFVRAQETQYPSGVRYWVVQYFHPKQSNLSPQFHEATPAARDAQIARVLDMLNNPKPLTYRDFSCPHCCHTERDGNTGPNGTEKICIYCRKGSVMTRCAAIEE